MKRFRFPLRPVAVLRAHREMRAREAFAAAVHAYVQAEEALAAARGRVNDLADVLFAGRSGRFLATDAANLFRVYRAECQAAMDAERRSIELRDAMQQRRSEYIDSNRQLKVVNRLEDKARARHRAENARLEQNELDEFAGYKAAHRPALP